MNDTIFLKFDLFSNSLPIMPGHIGMMIIENHRLYAKCLMSLLAPHGEEVPLRYSFLDSANKEQARVSPLVVNTLPRWPMDDTKIVNALSKRVLGDLIESEYEQRIEGLIRDIAKSESISLYGSYASVLSSPLDAFVKSMKLRAKPRSQAFVDNGIAFLDLLKDIGWKQPIVTINLSSFLDDSEFHMLAERVFFNRVPFVMFEPFDCGYQHEKMCKMSVDHDLCEFLSIGTDNPTTTPRW